MIKNFNEMFYQNVDRKDRAYNTIDTINVMVIHDWNWDGFMQQAVIYAFINFWESMGIHRQNSDHKWMYYGLNICYNRIVNNKNLFFGDHVVNSSKFINKTVEFIWKYRHCMWN